MSLEPDIIERVRHDFRAEDAEGALRLLRDSRITGRVARCVVFASRGSLASLEAHIGLANSDIRDAMMAGEYEGREPVRDLTVSFLIDSPEKLWAAGVAGMMRARGYTLTSIEARPATADPGPFGRRADAHEGAATFTGRKGEIRIEKRDGRWTVHADARELELHGLNRAFEDESAFRDAVSGYLLSNFRPKPFEDMREVASERPGRRPWWKLW